MNYETWPTLARNVSALSRWKLVLFFAICGPKFTKLNARMQERMQFATAFSVRMLSKNFWCFWAANFWGRDYQIYDPILLYDSDHRQTCQNLVTIDWATSEIRRWKGNKRQRHHKDIIAFAYQQSWRAAIKRNFMYMPELQIGLSKGIV